MSGFLKAIKEARKKGKSTYILKDGDRAEAMRQNAEKVGIKAQIDGGAISLKFKNKPINYPKRVVV